MKQIKYPLYVSGVRCKNSFGQAVLSIIDANENTVIELPYDPRRDQLDRQDADRLVRYANMGALIHALSEKEAA
jgi:hypothetical protein